MKAAGSATVDVTVEDIDAMKDLVGDAMAAGLRIDRLNRQGNWGAFEIKIGGSGTEAGWVLAAVLRLLASRGDEAAQMAIADLSESGLGAR